MLKDYIYFRHFSKFIEGRRYENPFVNIIQNFKFHFEGKWYFMLKYIDITIIIK